MNQNARDIMNPNFNIKEEAKGVAEAAILIEPLEQGFGHTLGNALRRVLLSSLPGCAITSVRVTGADHQFSSITGMTEDVLDLTLNIKQVRIKSQQEGTGVLRISQKGPKTVTAADIEAEAGFEVINPDQHIATLAKGAKLELEMTAATGLGYELADDKKISGIGEIMLDALYSPVIRVSYQVDSTRVGRRTDFDRLSLVVVTDGSMTPLAAVKQAAQILVSQFNQIVNPVVMEEKEPVLSLSPEEAEVLRLTVEELDLPTRIANALRKGGFKTVGDLVGTPRTTIAKVKNLGEKSVSVVEEALNKKGVKLGE
ncbi:MAG: DNA-directed RNA polymerase subunit alpha [Candidatus Pacebacteria bacterium CG_4_10_14_0_8_um_filter_43_12]|nr:MAG: DNA-directed RNA polymerase subunit alpha [Candidatus Pacebacteria bacterium CG10_big_fil_rev_8_21_14_0_10_44_11]PIY79532.1 MAG: DNA-directed RNA polymerase subunit alpha [Candidatus Pacebacteria bacterium CG_4_10_14_0_8_um_filter_43_12]